MGNFKKIFFVFVLFFLTFGAKSYAEIVNKVEVKGNERITLETIVIFGDITIGKNYESSDITLLIKKLYETNCIDVFTYNNDSINSKVLEKFTNCNFKSSPLTQKNI